MFSLFDLIIFINFIISTVSSTANGIAALAWEDLLSDIKFIKNSKVPAITVTRILCK